MKQEIFTKTAPGTLLPLEGEILTGYGPVEYHTCAFRPDRLDGYPEPTLPVMAAVSRATSAIGKLESLGAGIPNPGLLLRPTVRREAQSTSALEGTYERFETVLAADYEVGETKQHFSESMREVLNYVDAWNHGVLSVKEGRPIGVSLIRELQQLLVMGTRSQNDQAGDLRSTQVFIGAANRRIEDARFVPMPPGQPLADEVGALFGWWAQRSDPGVAVLESAMFHYQFETLHPFTDGNGRIGRLLILLQFMQRDLLHEPLMSISPWFESRRGDYQDLLLGVSTAGAWEDWILFFCQGIEESANEALVRVKALIELTSRYRERASSYGQTTHRVAELLIGSPYVTVPVVADRLQIGRSSAANAVRNLVKEGILKQTRTTGTRAEEYVAWEVMDALR
ncbi:Fic family protein [Bifidobacterium sp. AGR2158]|uniref:Fic family protein n=1 Tax=Bifidobacterium sp. AGR2158 TaxID=1280675 RepID=UPI000688D0AB|nr:Fic/DOC family N-terminal domain-containing protein [Bifidobacterium sp. AGR2158]